MNNADTPPPSVEDFLIDIEVNPAKLRQIIEGLRALPNISDMAMINAVAELDRIAGVFEEAFRKRERLLVELRKRAAVCDCSRCTAMRAIQTAQQLPN